MNADPADGWDRVKDAGGWREFVEAVLDRDSDAYKIASGALHSDTMRFTINRPPENIQPGRTISREAMDATIIRITAFIEARVLERWDRTNEPPTEVEIDIKVNAR